eukprot:TRINITY_DN75179_c0_g1_i1.p2 TRINITY_DN75179_c0_g1~~TRINITY_DN75179_c0_g1_i1.p2  ORF type:complete len:252 (-),score=100.05 TRINITY_DN75179_c0_g1_i1:154-909(-)
MAEAGREKLKQFIKDTLAKLEASPPPASVLKEKASPAVAGTIKSMLQGAPADVINEVKRILTDGGILPSHAANLTAFKSTLKNIHDYIDSMGKPAVPETVEEETAPAVEEYEEQDGPTAAEGEVEEEAGDYDPLEMMGGMGGEELYKVSMVEENEAEKAAAAAGEGRAKLLEYLSTTIGKLESSPPDAAVLKGRVMPMVVKSIKGMVDGAPPQVMNEVKNILTQNKVLPGFAADLESFKAAMIAVQSFVSK